jgi:glycogen debranching enzyme
LCKADRIGVASGLLKVSVLTETITLKDDQFFLVSDTTGEIKNGLEGHGLYFEDTRYLSCLELTINQQPPQVLNASADYNIAATFHLSSPFVSQFQQVDSSISQAQTAVAHAISVIRKRQVKGGLVEQLKITNFHPEPLTVDFSLKVCADFADIFEVRGFPRQLKGTASRSKVLDNGQRLEFRSTPVSPEVPARTLSLESSLAPVRYEINELVSPLNQLTLPQVVLHYRLELETGQPVVLNLVARPGTAGSQAESRPDLDSAGFAEQVRQAHAVFKQWEEECAQVQTDDYLFNRLQKTSLLDLRSLLQRDNHGHLVMTAGLPWYFSFFGRDSLITSIQTLGLNPNIAIDTLRALAGYQGKEFNDWRDEEPGKILHELRRGDMTLSGEMPHGPYYGSVDSTLLFIWCFALTLQWTGDREFFTELWPNVERALEWAEKYGDLDGDGFIEFNRRSERGILHQGWKDSDESMGGTLGPHPEGPIALVEVQGYYYAALTEIAKVLRQFGGPERQGLAQDLETRAARLKEKFNQDFWWPEANFYAQALDGQKQPVLNITSNPGHCLWSGIIDQDKAPLVAARLMQPDMLSGWGIRTISAFDPTYNPMSYHNGSTWPHDNSLVAAGLRRYGFDREALALIEQLFDAAATFPESRLPELYCGFPRSEDGIEEAAPAAYPVSCSPQAWAAGSGPFLLQTLLGLHPDGETLTVSASPIFPAGIEKLSLTGLKIGRTRTNFTFWRDSETGIIQTKTTPYQETPVH